MKNLTVHYQSNRSLPKNLSYNLQESKLLCAINSDTDDVYFIVKDQLHVISNDKCKVETVNIAEEARLVGLEFCSITQQLYCAYETGNIVTVNIGTNYECEVVAEVPVGLKCIKLSPDHELLTLITANDIVLTMLYNFQVLSEDPLHSSEFGQMQFITVGWGKKETQFHGTEGKAAAIAKQEIVNKNELDDAIPRITWRGDGSLFAVSFLEEKSKARQFKVFSREGTLQYTSEFANGLEESLAWKPSGSLIASTQRLANKYVVVFFEKNGLKHREFTFGPNNKSIKIKELLWSPDSEILTVWCENCNDKSSVLQLWTESNYHWYLKQSIVFTNSNPLICAVWSSTLQSGKKLIVLTRDVLITYSFHWTIHHSKGTDAMDKAIIGVIDGNKILLTALRCGIVPPPMCHQSLEIGELINAVIFAPNIPNINAHTSTNDFYIFLNNKKFMFFKWKANLNTLEYQCIGSYEIEWNSNLEQTVIPSDISYNMHHFLWFNHTEMLCSVSIDNYSFLCLMTVDNISETSNKSIIVKQSYRMEHLIEHIIPSPNPEIVYIIAGRSVLKYKKETEPISTGIKLPENCYQVEVIQVGKEHTIVSLSHRNCLSINGKEIANNITSFYVHSEFLLLTTLQHSLICVLISSEGIEKLIKQDMTIKPWENEVIKNSFTDLNIRRIERGSRLIAAVPQDSKTILQMPRGNLECIQPRALSIHIVGVHLNHCDYKSAFELMHKQRINLNLMYDHNPQLFLDNAQKFVEDIRKPSWLSLFLSELHNEDVTITIYKNCYVNSATQSLTSLKNVTILKTPKVAHVCELLRTIMESRQDAHDYIQPILISLVKNGKRQGLEAALRKLKEMKDLEESQKQGLQYLSANDALKYLLYLIDINVLYDTALGIYDFDLTMFIASKSQKDPKEYIPFLNSLKEMDEHYMKYSVDIYLKRHESALEHISKEPNKFNDCLKLICDHNLYMKGLKLFNKDTESYKQIAKAYGQHLLHVKKYQEAAIMFQKSKELKSALNAYKLAGSWQEAFVVGSQMKLSPTMLSSVYTDFVSRLKEDKRYTEAAYIMNNYVHDYDEGIRLLIHGKNFKTAIRIAHHAQRTDLIESEIKPGIDDHSKYIMAEINKQYQDFLRYKVRLGIVRTNLANQKRYHDEDIIDDNERSSVREVSDFLSDTTSIAGSVQSSKSRTSAASGKSYRSSKNRRKQERKLLNLKEGSAFEDIGLIQALYKIVHIAYMQKEEVNMLVEMLLMFDEDSWAEELQTRMNDLLQTIENSKAEIWNNAAPTSLSDLDDIQTQLSDHMASQKLIEARYFHPPDQGTTSQIMIF